MRELTVQQLATIRKARARRFAMQAVYSQLISTEGFDEVVTQTKQRISDEDYDTDFLDEILQGIATQQAHFESQLTPFLDRSIAQLGVIEHAILLVGAYELNGKVTPHKVAINEAIVLAKKFGAEDSYKYINGVLDKLYKSLTG
ncbi:transcription antitermination factor NusB [Ostreibacterium oceani]|uniref:Transcription antitermination protein NusB n=1 Tax=Ostreibacterium oceani TaxID=2654998 RepID=A0A6N7EUU4_9GAMM|nr:transcription antitermination factor NusB [Ostreibacterium oceani]MPV85290.1 transcription antitermination factor NusB [Ostreibacterium oceani]